MNEPLIKPIRGGGLLGAAFIVASLWCAVVHAQSPVGSWDCLLSQGREGVAQVRFADDGSLGGIAVYTPSGLGGSHTNNGVTRTNFFGSARLNGQWTFDGPAEEGRVTGYINFVSPALSQAVNATYGFSFHGKAKGEKLTFDAKGYAGRIKFQGAPLTSVPDVSGTFRGNGSGTKGMLPFVEIFTLTPALDGDTNVLNCYFAEGGGPGYDYKGIVLISPRNFAAFSQTVDTDGDALAAYSGRFDPNTATGTVKGTDGSYRKLKLKVTRVE